MANAAAAVGAAVLGFAAFGQLVMCYTAMRIAEPRLSL
jgi:hypothetical protein